MARVPVSSKKTFDKPALTGEALAEAVEANRFIYDRWHEPGYANSVQRNITGELDKNYFRIRWIGFDQIPERNNPERPLIYFGNHSGMTFPWDAVMLSSGMLKRVDFDMTHAWRPLVAPALNRFRLMNTFLIRNFWRRCGGVEATTLNFETMMQYRGSNVLIYPEGIGGIGKGFNKKYQLQRFATSFVRMSLKYKTDIIPICTVNGEYINPHSYSFDSVNRISAIFGMPFLPITWLLVLLPFFPWLFYFAFPARLTYVMGTRMRPYEWTDKPYEALTREDIEEITERVRHQFQTDLDAAVAQYGKEPYEGWRLLRYNLRNWKKLAFFHSPGWPLLFAEHERRYRKSGGRAFHMRTGPFSLLKALVMNPSTIAFFIPILGWIPILIQGYRSDD
jgi:1-acyl-sn-glycerol-3-phosphate acyltransferase